MSKEINFTEWIGSKCDDYKVIWYKNAINEFMSAIPEYVFTGEGYDGHPWNAWEFCGWETAEELRNCSPELKWVAFLAAREMYEYGDGWDNVANVVRVGAYEPERDDHYRDWYIEKLKTLKYYRLKPESVELLRNAFTPVLVMLDARLAEIEKAEKAEAASLKAIQESIVSCETKEKNITDEGGKTKLYTHTITLKDGEKLTFTERNVFDFGHVINPAYKIAPDAKETGGLCTVENGKRVFKNFKEEQGGWYTVRECTDNEDAAITYIYAFGGFAHHGIRM